MRVVHVAHSIAGGIASYFEEIAEFQSRAFGPENVFFIIPDNSRAHVAAIDERQLITFPASKRNPVGLWRFGRAARRAVSEIGPDVLHLHSSFAGGVLRLATRRKSGGGLLIVYCPHAWAFGMQTSNFRRFLYAEAERYLLRNTDCVIVNSDFERRLGRNYGIDPRRIKAVNNGIADLPERSAQEKLATSGPVNVVFVGRLDRQKGFDILLKELRTLPSGRIHLHVIGDGYLEQADKPDGEHITYYGWRPRSEALSLMARMDVLVMPSRWEAFPISLLEAMRAGLPVIVSDRSALPDIIRDGTDGYVVDIDEEGALSRALFGLDRSRLRGMGEAARARFREKFTSDKMNASIEGIYRSLLDKGEVSPAAMEGGVARASMSLPARSATETT